MAARTHTLSHFLQHSGRVLPEVERGEVVLRRREGPDLALMTMSQREALSTVLRVMVEIAQGGVGRAASVVPWLAFLSPHDQQTCVRELGDVARAAAESGRLDHLEYTLAAWRATGLATWDDQRLRERGEADTYAVDEPVRIARPGV